MKSRKSDVLTVWIAKSSINVYFGSWGNREHKWKLCWNMLK